MMSSEVPVRLFELRAHETRDPFVPFKLRMADGSVHPVVHPNLIMITKSTVMVFSQGEGEDYPDFRASLDPLHITRVELLSNGVQ